MCRFPYSPSWVAFQNRRLDIRPALEIPWQGALIREHRGLVGTLIAAHVVLGVADITTLDYTRPRRLLRFLRFLRLLCFRYLVRLIIIIIQRNNPPHTAWTRAVGRLSRQHDTLALHLTHILLPGINDAAVKVHMGVHQPGKLALELDLLDPLEALDLAHDLVGEMI